MFVSFEKQEMIYNKAVSFFEYQHPDPAIVRLVQMLNHPDQKIARVAAEDPKMPAEALIMLTNGNAPQRLLAAKSRNLPEKYFLGLLAQPNAYKVLQKVYRDRIVDTGFIEPLL